MLLHLLTFQTPSFTYFSNEVAYIYKIVDLAINSYVMKDLPHYDIDKSIYDNIFRVVARMRFSEKEHEPLRYIIRISENNKPVLVD